jgi:hypothetical protein
MKALLLLFVVALGCKREGGVRALGRDDGRADAKNCRLVAGGTIAVDTTVQAGCVVAVGETYAIVKGATLTIEPGARLAFAKGARLDVQDGALIARGSALEPVTFTSAAAVPEPGDWVGIVLASKSKGSVLEHVVVEFGGTSEQGAIHIADAAAPVTVVQSLVRKTPHVGLDVGPPPPEKLGGPGETPFAKFDGNTFEGNGRYAVQVPASVLGLAKTLSATEPVRVRGVVRESMAWPAVSSGFVVDDLFVGTRDPNETAVLTLAPDSIVRVAKGASLRFGDRIFSGALVATRVRFTSAADKPAPGDWGAIRFGKRAPGTVLDGCIIEFAAHDSRPAPKKDEKRIPRTALTITEKMKDFRITGTTFRDNAGPGIGLAGPFEHGIGIAFSTGTGGCEGLDAPSLGNKSVGKPLCEYHEDQLSKLSASDGALTGMLLGGVLGDDPSFGGVVGSGLPSGKGPVGEAPRGTVGGLGHGSGSGYGTGAGSGRIVRAAPSAPSSSTAP